MQFFSQSSSSFTCTRCSSSASTAPSIDIETGWREMRWDGERKQVAEADRPPGWIVFGICYGFVTCSSCESIALYNALCIECRSNFPLTIDWREKERKSEQKKSHHIVIDRMKWSYVGVLCIHTLRLQIVITHQGDEGDGIGTCDWIVCDTIHKVQKKLIWSLQSWCNFAIFPQLGWVAFRGLMECINFFDYFFCRIVCCELHTTYNSRQEVSFLDTCGDTYPSPIYAFRMSTLFAATMDCIAKGI